MSVDVRRAEPHDAAAMVHALTESFFTDPVMTWALPEEVRRSRLTVMWTVLGGQGCVPKGACTVLPSGDGSALWMPPGERLDESFWHNHGKAFFEGMAGDTERLSQLSDAMAGHHPDEDHWYLLAIGILPEAQGRGLGGTLLAHTLALADAAKQPAYLEATSPRSRVLYQRFGFEVTAEIRPGDGPTLWGMWREPCATSHE